MDGPLAGKTVLVTGASSGLGRRFATVLHDAGATVALTARRADRLEEHARTLDRAIAVPCDLSDSAQLPGLVDAVHAQLGPVDVLVNAAGGGGGGNAQDEPAEQITRTLQINVAAPLILAGLVYSDMIERGGGSIVNVGSISGLGGIGDVPQASYAASKGGLHALTRELAAQWSRYGIRVNCLAPGFFQSDMTAPLFDNPKWSAWIARGQMINRHATVEDFDESIIFLTSDASRYMTGQIMSVDGGWSAW
jgi:NAD(P)-dependent dehydrogenase (short-subunit alcohol dehydrogenase family)